MRDLRSIPAMLLSLGLAACGGSSPAQPPPTPAASASPVAARPAQAVRFTASSTDPQGGTPTYAWTFGDGANGTGASASHAYAAEGTFTARVTASNAAGSSAAASVTVTVAAQPPAVPSITASPPTAAPGQAVTLTAATTDPQGSAVGYAWTFGDGATGTGATVTHAWAATGTYSVQVAATNAFGKASSATAPVAVASGASAWTPFCAGSSCGALDGTTYAGTGVGVWRYANDTASEQTVDVAISGVSAANRALLLFTNGENASTSLPLAGVAVSPRATALQATPMWGGEPDVVQARRDEAHEAMLRRNQELGRAILGTSGSPAPLQAAGAPPATPAVGATRSWIDNGVSPPTTYTGVVAQAVCDLVGGRKAVFWVDPASWTAGDVTPDSLAAFLAAFCGASGGYARTATLLGEAWGPIANNYPDQLIPEVAGAPQDVNVVFLGVPADVPWGGYFWGGNNLLASYRAGSNEALAFFINAPDAKGSTPYYASVLVHELTHMVNFYQRYIVKGADHATWLEETSAMMSEDIVVPAVDGGYSDIPGQRLVPYLRGGGAVSLVSWPDNVPRPNYNMGGSLAAFLDRRYGTAVYRGLVACPGTAATASYTCLDGLIRANGGVGFADELARMGASAFAALPATAVPDGFGFPQKTSGAYTLAGIDLTASASQVQDPATALGTLFTATTHTYAVDAIAAGRTTYARTGIVVPPRTTVLLVIR